MQQNRHCQICWQILYPEKNVRRSTVTMLQVRGCKSPLLLRGKTLGLRCSVDVDRVMYKCRQQTEGTDVVRTAGTNFLSAPPLLHNHRQGCQIYFLPRGQKKDQPFFPISTAIAKPDEPILSNLLNDNVPQAQL